MTDATNTTTQQAAQPDQDQARLLHAVSDLDKQLGGETGQAPAPGASVGGAPAIVEDPVEENAAMLQSLVDVLAPALPFLPEIYTPKIVKQIAIAFTKVEQKHGWNVAGKLPPEVTLAIVAIPPTVQAFIVGKLYIEQMKGQAAAQGTAGAATDGHQ